MNKQLIYLASPHSHPDPLIRHDRYVAALDCTKWLFKNGFWVFSPIVHSHLFYGILDKGKGWEFWKEYDEEMIRRCDELWVLCIDGWEESKGVQAEIEIAKRLGKVIDTIELELDSKNEPKLPRNYIQMPRLTSL